MFKMEYLAPCQALVHIHPSEQGRSFLPLDLQSGTCQQIPGPSILLFHLRSTLLVPHQSSQSCWAVCTLCMYELELHKIITYLRNTIHIYLGPCPELPVTLTTIWLPLVQHGMI